MTGNDMISFNFSHRLLYIGYGIIYFINSQGIFLNEGTSGTEKWTNYIVTNLEFKHEKMYSNFNKLIMFVNISDDVDIAGDMRHKILQLLVNMYK